MTMTLQKTNKTPPLAIFVTSTFLILAKTTQILYNIDTPKVMLLFMSPTQLASCVIYPLF